MAVLVLLLVVVRVVFLDVEAVWVLCVLQAVVASSFSGAWLGFFCGVAQLLPLFLLPIPHQC